MKENISLHRAFSLSLLLLLFLFLPFPLSFCLTESERDGLKIECIAIDEDENKAACATVSPGIPTSIIPHGLCYVCARARALLSRYPRVENRRGAMFARSLAYLLTCLRAM